MASTFKLDIMTPYRKFFEDEVEMVVVKTIDGEVGVMKGHMPMVLAVDTGNIKILHNGEWKEAVLTEGFMEITQSEVVILVDTAEWPHEIDVERARAAKERAEERLSSQLAKVEYIRSRAAMARALARLKVTKKL